MGRHIVECALHQGHEVTLFHRGKTGQGLYPEATHLIGDRLGDVSALDSGEWDATVDVSSYVPRAVNAVASTLGPRAGHYVYISTISVYQATPDPVNEKSQIATLDDPTTEAITAETYGALKALCESAAVSHYPNTAILRPTYILGPYDHTNRFVQWVRKCHTGEEIVIPERTPQWTPFQWIDARDLAEFALKVAQSAWSGTVNTCNEPIGLETLPQRIDSILNTATSVRFGAHDEGNMPLTASPDGAFDGLMQTSNTAALQAGLKLRPIEDTIRDVAIELGIL